jgi:ribosome-binding protein aMBF1 (putative translation factor)
VQSNEKNKSKPASKITRRKPGTETVASKVPKRKFQSAAVQYLYDRHVGNDPERVREYEEEVLNAEIARKIYRLRTRAGISQRELAKRVGTTASAICRLEDADYEGHSLFMLKRIAAALNKRVEIRFVSAKQLRTA